MTGRFQSALRLAAGAALAGVVLASAAAQRPETETGKKEERGDPRSSAQTEKRAQRQQQNRERRQEDRRAQRQEVPPARYPERPREDQDAGPSRQPAISAPENAGRDFAPQENRNDRTRSGDRPPWAERLRELPPEERERVLQNSQRYNSLPPEGQERIRRRFERWDSLSPRERGELRERERIWRQMTPEQREHVRKEVLPRWQRMPPERRQAIQRRLSLLREIPESARNRRLSDPDFTRGMSAQDQSLLRDLSHLHVGGAPDPPVEQQP